MDGQLSRKKVIGSPIYEESLERIFVEGIERFGIFQARKYLEHILNTVEKLENDYPYYPECRHLATKSRMYRNIILDSHLIIYRITEERIEVLDIVYQNPGIRVRELLGSDQFRYAQNAVKEEQTDDSLAEFEL